MLWRGSCGAARNCKQFSPIGAWHLLFGTHPPICERQARRESRRGEINAIGARHLLSGSPTRGGGRRGALNFDLLERLRQPADQQCHRSPSKTIDRPH